MAFDMADAYAHERRRELLVRVRHLALLGLAIIALSVPVVLQGFADRVPERLLTLAVQAGLCATFALLAGRRNAERHALALALAFILCLAVAVLWALSLSPRDFDVLVGVVTAIMMSTALLLPWGVAPQVATSLGIALGYVTLVPWERFDRARATNIGIGLVDGVILSVLAALILEWQRRATHAEREQARALARQRALLLEAGRELNGTLQLDQVVERVARLAVDVVGGHAALLVLLDEARGQCRIVAHAGSDPRIGELVGVEFPAASVAAFLQALRRGRVCETPDHPDYARHRALMHQLGLGRAIHAAIVREDRLLGYLSLAKVSPEPFDEHHVALAEGIAHQAAIALANARLVDELREASRLKTEFVSTMSHELRTPLHVIMGYAEMLDDDAVRDTAVARIRSAGRELLELVEATLDLSRLESGTDAPRLEPVELGALWDRLAAELRAFPRAEAVELRWRPVAAERLVTDPRKLRIVVRNLVGNALKFTLAGHVDVACELEATAVRITVADTGVGIRPEQLPHIFEMFRQGDGSDTRTFGGVGLGLYIVHRFVAQLGGRVEVASEPGRGSTFTVVLPRRTARLDAAA